MTLAYVIPAFLLLGFVIRKILKIKQLLPLTTFFIRPIIHRISYKINFTFYAIFDIHVTVIFNFANI